ncbi:MAG: type II toxin-antitoxin system HipA family toxin, partial [Burkholderiales bacterium]
MTEALEVWLNEDLGGELAQDRGRLSFAYDPAWVASERFFPLSVTMPPGDQPYPDEVARAFFENLLPEGEIRAAIAKLRQLSERNTFGLLGEIGGDCAGAVSLWPPGERPRKNEGYAVLTEARLAEVLAETARRPLLVVDDEVRLSLAGAQNKLPVHVDGTQLSLPHGSAPSSHILKPGARGFVHMPVNEHFCMCLAEAVGLPVPPSTILRKPEPLYLVERYDRIRSPDGQLGRIHQIDFCQALNLPSQRKYEHEGGPSLEACFDVIARFSAAPARDRLRLISWVIFNFLIGNADAHAKNLSLLITHEGVTLAPFYDLVSTALYPDLTDKLALRIGGENRPDWIQARHWESFAEVSGANPRIVRQRIAELAESILPAARQ